MYAELNPFLLIFLSYGFGALASVLVNRANIQNWFANNHYVSDRLTKQLGVLKFGWLIRHSFMGQFNPNLKYKGKANIKALEQLKKEMTNAEISHLIGFFLLLIFTLSLPFWGFSWWYVALMILFNFFFNLYLVFLQQYNKRRIDKLIRRIKTPG